MVFFNIIGWSSTGEESSDLSFTCGEVLTIIEPCDVVYWYLAENKAGKEELFQSLMSRY